jgi:RNA polymerase sporulation-specific sigma factor
LLSDEEKEALFLRMAKGDKQAKEELIEGNLRLVLIIIQRFNIAGNESGDDLFQVGCIGLIKAINNFDINFGVKFSSYAVPLIIGECRRYLRDNSSIRVSRSLRDMAYKAIYAKENLRKTLDREPTIEEIAKEVELNCEDVIMALDAIATPMSLNEPVYQDGEDKLYLMDQIRDKKNTEENWVENLALKDAMARLDERELDIIKLRFFEGKTQTEVASEISISQAQVSRLEKNAISSMRNYMR